MPEYDPDDPLHDLRQEQLAALHEETGGLDPDRPTRAEIAEDEAEWAAALQIRQAEARRKLTQQPTNPTGD